MLQAASQAVAIAAPPEPLFSDAILYLAFALIAAGGVLAAVVWAYRWTGDGR
jgi:hypothetical protein